MKKYILFIAAIGSTLGMNAQSAMDAFTASQSQLRGTARYVSMGGAFGALGGDLSTLNQNPAGLGVYRSSEFGATLDVDFLNATMKNTGYNPMSQSQTSASCNNFGYAGSMRTGSDVMPYFAWGATYNRIMSYDRKYKGYFPTLPTSWTNYVASFSGGYSPQQLWGTETYDPFFDSNVPWISALAYNSYLINQLPGGGYTGLMQAGSWGDAAIEVCEQGYLDEYSINFGGNFSNMFYWGIAFGINDISYKQTSYYDEKIKDALVQENEESLDLVTGDAEWGIKNLQTVSGTGFNVKLGLIFKPINEFRLGFAVHTPTWYNLTYNSNAWTDYGLGKIENDKFYTIDSMVGEENPYATTTNGYWDRKLKSPWRLMASAAGVIGGRFIISADYVYEAYSSMSYSDEYGELTDISNDIKRYYQPTNELRLGAEFRITPSWSVRAGYNYKSSASKTAVRDGMDYIYTVGTQSMNEFKGDRNTYSVGLGYRTGGFYIDAAFVHSTQNSSWSAFSSFPTRVEGGYDLAANALTAPRGTITTNHNNLVVSLGFKF